MGVTNMVDAAGALGSITRIERGAAQALWRCAPVLGSPGAAAAALELPRFLFSPILDSLAG
jgi:hypothetical protein